MTPAEKMTPHMRRVVTALIFGGMAGILDSTIVTIALRTLVRDLHSSIGSIQWVTTGYLLALAVAIPVTGWAQARWGGKRVWLAALVIFVVGSVLCAASWNDASLIAFRVLQGFGAGLIFPLMQTLAVQAAGGRASSELIAVLGLPLALGPVLGPVVGGVVLNWLSWRWLFLINVPLIAVGLVLAVSFLPADPPPPDAARPRLDAVGLCLLAPALVGVLLGLSNIAQDGGLGAVAAWLPLALGVALLVGFAGWALRRRDAAIVDVALLRLRSLATATAALSAAGAVLYAGMFLLPLYWQELRGDGVLTAALLLVPQGVGSLLARIGIGRLVRRFGARTVTITAFLVVALGTVPFALAGPHTNVVWLGVVLLVRGLGVGAVLIPPMSVAYDDVDATRVPQATMTTRIGQQVGGSFGIAIVAVALQSAVGGSDPARAFHAAFWWAVGISVAALVAAATLPGRHRTVDAQPGDPSAGTVVPVTPGGVATPAGVMSS